MQVKIAIYPPDTTNFDNQGFGILTDVLKAESSEKAQNNGATKYELDLDYPIDGPLANKLRQANLIRVPVDDSYMIFEIYDYLDDENNGTITALAQAFDYRFSSFPFDDGGYIKVSGDIQKVLDYAVNKIVDFPKWFKIKADFKQDLTIDTRFENFGKFFDHLLVLTKGQVSHQATSMTISKAQNKESEKLLRYDKNIIGMTVKYDYSTIVNKIIPIQKVKEQGSSEIVGSPITSSEPFKFINYWRGKNVEYEEGKEVTQSYFEDNDLINPSMTVDVKPALFDDDVSKLKVFENVKVYSKPLNFIKEITVIEKKMDHILNQVTDLKLGTIERTIYQAQDKEIQNVEQNTNEKIEDVKDDVKDVKEDVKDAKEQISDQEQKAKEEIQKVTEAINKARDDLTAKIQNKADVLNYGKTAIEADNLSFGADGLIYKGGGQTKIAIGADGRVYADDIYGKKLTGIEMHAGTYIGGTYDAAAYYRSVGANNKLIVISGDNGLSYSTPYGTWAIGDTAARLPKTNIEGDLYVNGNLKVQGTINGKAA